MALPRGPPLLPSSNPDPAFHLALKSDTGMMKLFIILSPPHSFSSGGKGKGERRVRRKEALVEKGVIEISSPLSLST